MAEQENLNCVVTEAIFDLLWMSYTTYPIMGLMINVLHAIHLQKTDLYYLPTIFYQNNRLSPSVHFIFIHIPFQYKFNLLL